MKFIFLIGGAAGFFAAIATDFFSGRNSDRLLIDGAFGCLAGAFLFRWFWGVLLQGVRETYLARRQAAAAAVPTPIPVATPAPAKTKT
jgi:hypothetical protein